MRFRLRTLLIVLVIGPPVLAGAWLLLTTNAAGFIAERIWVMTGWEAPGF